MKKNDVRIQKRLDEELATIQHSVAEMGFAVLPASTLTSRPGSLSAGLQRLAASLEQDETRPDRKRVMDTVEYRRNGSIIELEAYPQNTMPFVTKDEDRDPLPRFESAQVSGLDEFITGLLALIPTSRRHDRATMSVHLLETSKVVTTDMHQDDVRFIAILVADKSGTGGEVQLTRDLEDGETLVSIALPPGAVILFDDRLFRHYTTDLRGTDPKRLALVVTVNHPRAHEAIADLAAGGDFDGDTARAAG